MEFRITEKELERITQVHLNEIFETYKQDVKSMEPKIYGRDLIDTAKANFQEDFPGVDPFNPVTAIFSDNFGLDLILDSDSYFYNKYVSPVVQEQEEDYISAKEFINAYREGLLPKKNNEIKFDKIDFEKDLEIKESPFGVQKTTILPKEELLLLWQLAITRATKSNSEQVFKARYDFFNQYLINKNVHTDLGLSKSEINKKISSWTGMTQEAKRIHEEINNDVPEHAQWSGIINSTFIAKNKVEFKDLSPHFDKISGERGNEYLNRMLLNTIMAIDTGIEYKDLKVHVEYGAKELQEKYLGIYHSGLKTIVLKQESQHTLNHEMGHYLDHKWGVEFGFGFDGFLSSFSADQLKSKNINEKQRLWAEKYLKFVENLKQKSRTTNEYYFSNTEIIARFFDFFISRTTKISGHREQKSRVDADAFTEQDFMLFVRILQEKADLDAYMRKKSKSNSWYK